jgi:hypothetical protein
VLEVKLDWIEFENLRTELKIKKVLFNKDITLLVGLSGVGKTQILSAIEYSLKLAVNKNLRLEPYAASLGFHVDDKEYVWSYRIEQDLNEDFIESKEMKYVFTYEELFEVGTSIMKRELDNVQVIGYDKVPTPKKDESLLVQYSEEKFIKPIITELLKLYPIEMDMDVRGAIDRESFNMFKAKIKENIKKNDKLGFEKFSHLPVLLKIYITKKYYPEKFVQIFSAVKELFLEINDIDIVEDTARDFLMVAIDVYGKKLMQHEISNGMLKTIYYIVELITMSENSLVLIDEFENGLGVNCIDVLAELLLSERNDLQFIITSHHPKIINQISNKKWKIIERDIATVNNISAEEYGITHSQHDAYFNLINRWEYEGKI